MKLTFEWDEVKATANLRKHGVAFEEAKTIFGDPLSCTVSDRSDAPAERRFVDIGRSSHGRLLAVVYTERRSVIRLISARGATRLERREYEEGEGPA